MSCVEFPPIPTFADPHADKEQSRKVLEEAAEVFAAMQQLNAWRQTWSGIDAICTYDCRKCPYDDCTARAPVVEECADLIQALSNMLAGIGITDMRPAIRAVQAKNEKRGYKYG